MATSTTKPNPKGQYISDATYDVLKAVVQLVLPALGTLYFALAQTWGWTNAEQVVGSITAIALFLGVLLAVLAHKYNGDGTLEVDEDDESVAYSLDVHEDPYNLKDKNQVTFKVRSK